MKKQLLAIALLTAGLANAQVWSENFNSAVPPALPAGWMQINGDGFTPDPAIASYSFGTNAMVTRNVTSAFGLPSTYSISLISTSAYTPAGISNDWAISPQFTVPANAVFNWQATAFDPNYRNGYEVRISTTGTTISSFTANPALFSIGAEVYSPTSFTQRGVSLAAYAGQSVYIAIHDNSNDKWQNAYDNFAVTVPANATDGGMLSVSGVNRYMIGAGSQTISGTFKELGYATATTAVVNYKVNNGTVVTQTLNFAPNVPYYGTSTFSFSTPANMALGTNNIKVWVSHVNGTPEVVLGNDTAFKTVYVASVSKTRNALIEEFSSSTCVPCAALNSTFDPLLNANTPNTGGRVNVIKNQVNWPAPNNDPSYNAESAARVNFYGINAAPTALTNGTLEMVNHTQGEIDAAKAIPAIADITATISVNGSNQVTANSTITPYVTISAASPLRVHQVLAQSNYSFANPSTSQTSFFHVMRKMFPDANGTAVTTTDGTAQTFSFTHSVAYASIYPPLAAQNSNNFWNAANVQYEYIVFLQDAVSGDILQSGSAQTVLSTGIVEFKNNSSIGIYPNPAKEFVTLGIKLNNPSVVETTITDISGKVVYSSKTAEELTAGTNEVKINTSEFATGTYNVVVKTAEGTLSDKLIVVK